MTEQDIENSIIYQGFNSKKELSVIVSDFNKYSDILHNTYPEFINIYPEDKYIKCNNCNTIIPITDASFLDLNLSICSTCFNSLKK